MSTVELQPFDEDAGRLLQYAQEVGVVLDFVLVNQVADAGEEKVHRDAVVLGITEASRKRGVPAPFGEPEWGRRIDLATFYGSRFDQKGRRLLLHAGDEVLTEVHRQVIRGDKPYGPYTWSDQDDLDHMMWFDLGNAPTGGFPFVFSEPPYGLPLTHPEIQRLFLAVVDVILQAPTDDSEIWEWEASSRWASYFTLGEDWWGTGAWTLRVSGNRLVVIGASTTDI